MSGIYDETVFDEQPDDDLDEPEDGRYGTPEDGSSDNPETMDRIDPLRRHSYLVVDDLEDGGESVEGDSEDETLASQWELDDEQEAEREDDED
ncbi:MAG: hypothetical protein ACTHWW_00360 [Arthrobacter sp.]|uniref:hypothetical protein n=1 Tax=unclassified Arthrobacter TaxID=235627 RepID=UPI00264E6D9E|nr:hypothetical protein [Micrococcaceae bacterium]MDN5813479.1 hypothetical protein [Micrococcaceae bacterium]MDN5824316.1 hypothetical protein [Micrococcaceae bacterium]MDN5880382.1 hypothetical protein [Micrococcaceae bacterium]MDN5886419.1 hypothetical protein [Micrococcaceae bacterium]